MNLNEISLTELLNKTSGTNYFPMFAKLIGKDDVLIYDGITDDDVYLLEELEMKLGYALPSHYLELLGIINGGHFLGMDMFSVAEKEYPNSLYARNFLSNLRNELELEESALIIGKYQNYILYVDCEDLAGSYVLMDIRNQEKVEFESFNALLGFIFYMLVINENKKLEEEKKLIKKMRDDLHKGFVLKNKLIKKEKEKNRAKLMAKTAGQALKEKQKRLARSKK